MSTMKDCLIESCGKSAWQRGWCKAHYLRWYRHGDPLAGGPAHEARHGSPEERYWRYLDPCRTDNEWLWTGHITENGYAQIRLPDGSRELIHRFAYRLFVGPIPTGLQVDHVRENGCFHRDCSNPAHLEAVTPRVNSHRSDGPASRNAKKTHCPYGHTYDAANTSHRNGRRFCRICERRHWTASNRKRSVHYSTSTSPPPEPTSSTMPPPTSSTPPPPYSRSSTMPPPKGVAGRGTAEGKTPQ